jgi:hypothetical protein
MDGAHGFVRGGGNDGEGLEVVPGLPQPRECERPMVGPADGERLLVRTFALPFVEARGRDDQPAALVCLAI